MAPQDVLFLDGCLLDVIEVREVFRQIRVAFRLNAPLFGPLAARCAFTIPAVYLIDDGHPGDDLTKWRETLAVQARVVLEIDEYLRGSRVGRPTHRVGDRKSTRLNSSHITISYAVFCLKKKKKEDHSKSKQKKKKKQHMRQ